MVTGRALSQRIGGPDAAIKESGAIRTGMAAGARYRAPAWLLAAARRAGGSPSLPLMACWTWSLPSRESTVMTYSLRRKNMSAGHQLLPRPLPANFRPPGYAPGQALDRRADVMIHHGGHGSTLTALAAGTPALIIPTYSERESNARHAAALGVALLPGAGNQRRRRPA